jgi:hypothetical protein
MYVFFLFLFAHMCATLLTLIFNLVSSQNPSGLSDCPWSFAAISIK